LAGPLCPYPEAERKTTMSASAARQTANTANAQLSTGPRTPEGKARSSANARKHGLTAVELLVGPEDREEFDALLADYQSDVAPQGVIQQTLFDELVAAAWNLRRIRRMETELCAGAASYQELLNDHDLQIKLDRLARHKARIERTFHRCLKELKALQTTQAIAALLPRDIREFVPPLASTIEIAKRTQAARSSLPLQSSPDAFDLQWIAPADTGQATTAA
jgi:hypothetical protein